jgi:hypothetical protein
MDTLYINQPFFLSLSVFTRHFAFGRKKEEVTGWRWKFHNEELLNLLLNINIVRFQILMAASMVMAVF